MKLTFWDAVNPFAGEYIFDEPQQRLEFIITAAIAAVLLLLFCICLKRAIKNIKRFGEKVMSLSKNQNVELYIDSFTSEGSGVGRYENMAVFVSGAAAGDKVTAHIIKVKKTYAVARVEKVLKPAKSRIMPACLYFRHAAAALFSTYRTKKKRSIRKSASKMRFLI